MRARGKRTSQRVKGAAPASDLVRGGRRRESREPRKRWALVDSECELPSSGQAGGSQEMLPQVAPRWTEIWKEQEWCRAGPRGTLSWGNAEGASGDTAGRSRGWRAGGG